MYLYKSQVGSNVLDKAKEFTPICSTAQLNVKAEHAENQQSP